MSIPVEHKIKLVEVNDASKPYKFLVSCNCQWTGLAHTRLVAERWINSHAWAQTLRGNTVTIDRGTLGEVSTAVGVNPQQPIVADALLVPREEMKGTDGVTAFPDEIK